MLTNFKEIGKRIFFCLSTLKINAWLAARPKAISWILALSHAAPNAALPVAVGNTTLPSLAPLLKEVTPAVVNISVL